MATCFKLHLDYGITNSPFWKGTGAIDPTIETTLVHTPEQKSIFDFAMTIISSVFNLTYVILVNLVLSAIVAGLIIDTFSQMRSENEAIEEDMQEKCFICSIDRDLIESAGISFHDHIRNQHNMWSYFWFRMYLEGKVRHSSPPTPRHLYTHNTTHPTHPPTRTRSRLPARKIMPLSSSRTSKA